MHISQIQAAVYHGVETAAIAKTLVLVGPNDSFGIVIHADFCHFARTTMWQSVRLAFAACPNRGFAGRQAAEFAVSIQRFGPTSPAPLYNVAIRIGSGIAFRPPPDRAFCGCGRRLDIGRMRHLYRAEFGKMFDNAAFRACDETGRKGMYPIERRIQSCLRKVSLQNTRHMQRRHMPTDHAIAINRAENRPR